LEFKLTDKLNIRACAPKRVFSFLFTASLLISGCGTQIRSLSQLALQNQDLNPVGVVASSVAYPHLCVSDYTANKLLVFDKTDSGNIAPIRSISGGATTLNGPAVSGLDLVNNEWFVSNSNNNRIKVFSLSASGNTAPLRSLTIPGPYITSVEVDTIHNEIFVARSDGTILVYPRTATGADAPVRTISGGLTELTGEFQGLRFDHVHDEIFATLYDSPNPGKILVFSRTANGNVAPLRVITGAATELGTAVMPLFLDLENDEIITASDTSALLVFARTANGNTAPIRSIKGAATLLNSDMAEPFSDWETDLIYIADYTNGKILAFPRLGTGNIAPTRIIAGGLTGLNSPWGLVPCP
jgi:WD40 repeat protein